MLIRLLNLNTPPSLLKSLLRTSMKLTLAVLLIAGVTAAPVLRPVSDLSPKHMTQCELQ